MSRINCLAALSKCSRLRCLNMKWVSEGILLEFLLRSIHSLDSMVTLHLPRSASHDVSKLHWGDPSICWPRLLRELHLNGNFLHNNLMLLDAIPPSTTALYFDQSKFPVNLNMFLQDKGSQLQFLRLGIRQETTEWDYLWDLAERCIHLQHLSMNLELMVSTWKLAFEDRAFQRQKAVANNTFFPNLKVLEIDSLVVAKGEWHSNHHLDELSDIIFDPIMMPPKLRKLLIHNNNNWLLSGRRSRTIVEIHRFLKALAREDGEGAMVCEEEAGVDFSGV